MRGSKPALATDILRFSCCGVGIAVEFDSRVPASDIRSVLPPEFSEFQGEEAEHHFSLRRAGETDQGEQAYLAGEGSTRAGSPERLDQVLFALRKNIHHCIAEYSRDRIFLHAGVVAWRGRGVICPGRSFSGKSTLVLAMVNSGATYYSDEYAVFDDNGDTHPFPVPISLREVGGWGQRIAADHAGIEALRPSLVLFAQYRRGRRWKPNVLTPGETVLRLLRNSISMRRNPEAVLKVLKKVASTARAYAGERDDADTVIDWLAIKMDMLHSV